MLTGWLCWLSEVRCFEISASLAVVISITYVYTLFGGVCIGGTDNGTCETSIVSVHVRTIAGTPNEAVMVSR